MFRFFSLVFIAMTIHMLSAYGRDGLLAALGSGWDGNRVSEPCAYFGNDA